MFPTVVAGLNHTHSFVLSYHVVTALSHFWKFTVGKRLREKDNERKTI